MPTRIEADCAARPCALPYYSSGYCKLHYNRIQKGRPVGTAGRQKAEWGAGNRRPDGYSRVHDHHPLAAPDGRVYVHRRVHFDETGPDPRPCVWCGRVVSWDGVDPDRLVVDHLDFDPSNNAPDNLASACHPCNSIRHRKSA